ncbi:MAG: non-homologous end joining protein Ku [Candidatus Hodarchaeales archaeon]
MVEKAKPSNRPIWTGSLTIGLVNLPLKLFPMIYDKGISFRFLHKTDGQPLKYQKVCTKDKKVIPWEEVSKGYEVSKNMYVMLDTKELKAIRPESDKKIRISKFVDYLSVDPIYYNKSYVLMPDKNKEAYSLLLTALQKKGKAAVGKITLRTKEYPVLVHAYRGSLVLTTMRYSYDVVDPQEYKDLKNLEKPKQNELEIANKIIEDLSGEFNIDEFEDQYSKKVEEIIKKKLKGQTIKVEKPQKEEAKELMVALRETLKQLQKK